MSQIAFFGKTDLGMVRTNNEDAFVVQYVWDENHVLAVAIDGVGGYEGGEVASAIAQRSIVEYLEKYPNGERLDLLKQAVAHANNAICSEREVQPNLHSMSCVLTAALIELEQKRINMAHVGDTRLYQYANGVLTKLSHDHSLVGYREEVGELTEEEAMKHPQRNVISKDVGSKLLNGDGGDYIETALFPLVGRSTLLLCSDGLSDMLTSAKISAVLDSDMTVEEKAGQLIAEANAAGGKDNVTVVLVEINIDEEQDVQEAHEETEYMESPAMEDAAVDSDCCSEPNFESAALAPVEKEETDLLRQPIFNGMNDSGKSPVRKKSNLYVLVLVALIFGVAGYFLGSNGMLCQQGCDAKDTVYVRDTIRLTDTLFVPIDTVNAIEQSSDTTDSL